MVLYNLFLLIYTLLAKCTAPFNGKVKQWVLGQEGVWDEVNRLAEKIQKPIIWVHCASYGEFEQGLPIIEKIKADYPGYQVWLTFFHLQDICIVKTILLLILLLTCRWMAPPMQNIFLM